MMLLSDGTVMAQGGGSTTASKIWYQLTPDASGSYQNGTWSQLASMSLERLYYASNVLPDGRVFVEGGEYSGPGTTQNFTNKGEIYDPVANSWSNITNFPLSQFGDDPSELLPDGRVLAGYLLGPQTYIYDPNANTWTQAGTKLANDRSDEETWIKLPDDSILTYDVFNNGHSQRYIPAQNQWVDAGNVPVNLSSSQVGSEMGPATLLPDGRALFVGATNHTALYNPSTNTWTAGPDMPTGLGADDAPGVMLPNGHFIFAADQPLFHGPTHLFDFDYTTNSLTELSTTGLNLTKAAYFSRMLMLPSGQGLLANSTNQLFVYTPNEPPDPSWQPVVKRVQDLGGGTFQVAGFQFNGISEGASYGDDAEMSSNYPIVQLTDGNGNVFYARTHNWNSTGVATSYNRITATYFDVPAGITPGTYSLSVIANGIASNPVSITVPGAAAPITPIDLDPIGASAGFGAQGAVSGSVDTSGATLNQAIAGDWSNSMTLNSLRSSAVSAAAPLAAALTGQPSTGAMDALFAGQFVGDLSPSPF
jgi:hypothetical protein